MSTKPRVATITTRLRAIGLRRWLVLVVLGILLGWMSHFTWHAYHLVRLGTQIQRSLEENTIQPLPGLLHQAGAHVNAIHVDCLPLYPVLRLASPLPAIGPVLGQVEPLMQSARALIFAADETLAGLEPLWQAENSNQGFTQRLSQAVVAGGSHFQQARKWLNVAQEVDRAVHPEVLPQPIEQRYRQVRDHLSLFSGGIELLIAAPDLMGVHAPQDYLLLAQNEDELRATGGFISGIGILRISQGQVANFSIGDSYSVDDLSKPYPYPPEPIQQLTQAAYWLPRDGNWSPDFPVAARQVQDLYTLSTGQATHGVIAFDQTFIQAMVEVLGPIQLASTPEPVASQNIRAYFEQAWEVSSGEEDLSSEWWLHRKDFMQELGGELFERALQLKSPSEQMQLLTKILWGLEHGHVQVYFNHSGAQAALREAGLDHRLDPGEQDYLFLVDSNMGFNKVDPLINRSLTYSLDLSNILQPTAEIKLQYQHHGTKAVACQHVASYGSGAYQDMRERCYWNYWRIYQPAGAQLITARVPAVPGENLLSGQTWPAQIAVTPGEHNTQVFAGLLVLPPNRQQELRFETRLDPGSIQVDEHGKAAYRLVVQKQVGGRDFPLSLRIRLPIGSRLIAPPVGWSLLDDGQWVWKGTLSETQVFSFQFTLPASSEE